MTKYLVLRAFSCLTLAAILLLGAGTANAAETTAEAEAMAAAQQEMLEQMAKEPPLALSDIDDYIRLLPSILELQETMGYDIDPAELERILIDHKIDPNRFNVLMPKVSLATMSLMGIDLSDQLDMLPAAIQPSAEEVKLVEDNWDRIQQVYMMAHAGDEEAAEDEDAGAEEE